MSIKPLEDITLRDMTSARVQRAGRFYQMIYGMLRDFLPADRKCHDHIEDHLVKIGYDHNFEIIRVPPECDHLDKLKLEMLRFSTHLRQTNLQAAQEDMLAALVASEKEYNEESAPVDAGCIECTAGTVPNRLNTGLCAHHLRVAAIKKATGAFP